MPDDFLSLQTLVSQLRSLFPTLKEDIAINLLLQNHLDLQKCVIQLSALQNENPTPKPQKTMQTTFTTSNDFQFPTLSPPPPSLAFSPKQSRKSIMLSRGSANQTTTSSSSSSSSSSLSMALELKSMILLVLFLNRVDFSVLLNKLLFDKLLPVGFSDHATVDDVGDFINDADADVDVDAVPLSDWTLACSGLLGIVLFCVALSARKGFKPTNVLSCLNAFVNNSME